VFAKCWTLGTQCLTREGLQGQIEQVLGAALGPQDPVVADSAGTEHKAGVTPLSSAVGDMGEDVKVTAHVQVLAHPDPHGHPRLLLLR
jgi:hypothetical protein